MLLMLATLPIMSYNFFYIMAKYLYVFLAPACIFAQMCYTRGTLWRINKMIEKYLNEKFNRNGKEN